MPNGWFLQSSAYVYLIYTDDVELCANANCPTENGGCYVEETTPVCFCLNGYHLESNLCKSKLF